MKKSWVRRYLVNVFLSGVVIVLFQNCGPAQLNTKGEGPAESSPPPPANSSDDLTATPSTDTGPSATPVATPVATPACAPAPTSNLVVDIKTTGAIGNGIADDTAAIQAAINQVAGTGGTVFVPAGLYMINAVTSLSIADNMTMKLAAGAELKAITNSSGTYTVLAINGKSNINIIGGTISGERNTHIGTTGQWGVGIRISSGTNIVVENTLVRDAWGDGIMVSGSNVVATNTNVKFCTVKAFNNRRQGLAITAANGLLIQNSSFENSNGTAPGAGINIDASRPVANVTIKNSQFMNNQGFAITAYEGSASTISNLTIEGNKISNNNGGIQIPFVTNSSITANTISDSAKLGIRLYLGALGNTVSDNDITVTGVAAGSALLIDPGNIVSNNTLH